MVPYVYLIGWKNFDTWYCGVRYKKNCSPDDLWNTYFTSSKYVKRFVEQHGDPDYIEILKTFENIEDARLYEQHILKTNDVLNKPNWLNRAIGGHFAGTRGPLSEETKQKISLANKGKKHGRHSEKSIQQQKETFKRNYSENRKTRFENRSKKQKGRIITEEHKYKISQTLTGRKLSDAVKLKISKTVSANRWFTNGVSDVFVPECPNGFWSGRSNTKSMKWFTDGFKNVRSEFCPDGFKPGRIKSL